MPKKKRINPHRRPASQADIAKAQKGAVSEAVSYAWAIIFTVLRDKFGFGAIRLRRVWDEINALSESVSSGYVSVNDMITALEDEAGIVLQRSDK